MPPNANPKMGLLNGLQFYKTVIEGANYEEADWKDSCCVRTSQIHWREDHSVTWLERHVEMTQGFILVGNRRHPGLFVLGEPTHDRDDLREVWKSVDKKSDSFCGGDIFQILL